VKAAHYLREALVKTGKFKAKDYPFFNEFVLETTMEEKELEERLLDINILPPLKLSTYYPELVDSYLFAVTEIFKKDDLSKIVDTLGR